MSFAARDFGFQVNLGLLHHRVSISFRAGNNLICGRVCLFGQSIGTAVALDMAKRGLGAKCERVIFEGCQGVRADVRPTLEYEDGRAETVVSDASWTVPGVGPAAEIGAFGYAPWGVPSARSSGAPEGPLSADDLVLPPGFAAERRFTVPRAFGA